MSESESESESGRMMVPSGTERHLWGFNGAWLVPVRSTTSCLRLVFAGSCFAGMRGLECDKSMTSSPSESTSLLLSVKMMVGAEVENAGSFEIGGVGV